MRAKSIRVCFDTSYLKVTPAVKFNPNRFSNPNFFFKEEPMNYFLNVFLTLTFLISMKMKIIWKHVIKKKPTFVLSSSLFDITPTHCNSTSLRLKDILFSNSNFSRINQYFLMCLQLEPTWKHNMTALETSKISSNSWCVFITSERWSNSREYTTWRKEIIWNLPMSSSLLKVNSQSIILHSSFQFETSN